MIIVDGIKTDFAIKDFANLEEILNKIKEEDSLKERIVTEVLVNGDTFSEIYPHQAEDIEANEITSVEIRSIPVKTMVLNMIDEMSKVNPMIDTGSKQVASLFRQSDNEQALELFQDLLEVIRNYMSMIESLGSACSMNEDQEYKDKAQKLSSLIGEMSEVLESEDWILLADLLEYELEPNVASWKTIVQSLRQTIQAE